MFAMNSPTCSGPKTSPLCHVPRFIKGEGSEKLTAINDLTKTLIVRKGLDCGLVRPHVLMAFVPTLLTACTTLQDCTNDCLHNSPIREVSYMN